MGKLYYITGSSKQIREQVYYAILQWSQTQQMQPLRPWTMSDQHQEQTQEQTQEEPNFYLYDYLAYGNSATLIQLIAAYGEEIVEPVYLRSREETEMMLLERGIYKSYEPYTNLAQCLKEIVETVFMGYQAVSYDFAAALRQQKQQQMQAKEAQQSPQPNKNGKKAKRRKNPLPLILMVIVWALLVCLLTATIYNAVTQEEKVEGNLVHVTDAIANDFTAAPLNYNGVSVFPGMNTEDGDVIAVVFEPGSQVYHIPNTSLMRMQKSRNGKIAAILTDSGLLCIADADGVCALQFGKVSQFALSLDGEYLYFISDGQFCCYEINTDTIQYAASLEAETIADTEQIGDGSMVTSPDGMYCAYGYEDGLVVILDRQERMLSYATTEFQSLSAISSDGEWLYGHLCNKKGFVRADKKYKTVDYLVLPGEEDTSGPYYFTEDGTKVIYQTENRLFFFNQTGKRTKLSELNGESWRPFVSNSLITAREYNAYFIDLGTQSDAYWTSHVWLGDKIYLLNTAETNQESLTLNQDLQAKDALWQAEDHFIYSEGKDFYYGYTTASMTDLEEKIELPAEVADTVQQVLGGDNTGNFFYVNVKNELCYYNAQTAEAQQYIPFESLRCYTLTKDGTTLYYVTEDGTVGWILKDLHASLGVDTFFPAFDGEVGFQVTDAGVYLHYIPAQSCLGVGEVYHISHAATPYVTYLGESPSSFRYLYLE